MLRPENVGNDSATYRDLLSDQKAETRRRILEAARAVFLRAGFQDANLNEVAQGAGVGKGTLYRHFESKGELYVAMLAENGESLARELGKVIDPEASALEQLAQVGAFYVDFWQRFPEHFQLIGAVHNSELVGPLTPELHAHLRRVFETPLRTLEALIRRGVAAGEIRPVDPWNTANALALGANAIIAQMIGVPHKVVDRDPVAVYQQFQDVILAGLAVEPRRH